MSETSEPIKVAILGGGMAALTTAFELTDPSQQGRYDVTVYQLGWRLGGKGASGRNAQQQQRIEEHGLHIWLGCYENSFHLMRRCYADLGRSPESPLGTVEQAFKPHSRVVLMEMVGDQWQPWEINFPSTGAFPGQEYNQFTLWDYVLMVLEKIPDLLAPHVSTHLATDTLDSAREKPPEWQRLAEDIRAGVVGVAQHVGGDLLHAALLLARSLGATPQESHAQAHNTIRALLDQFRANVWSKIAARLETEHTLRHMWIMLDLAIANIRGILADGLLFKSLDTINNWDYSDWLSHHGATSLTLASPPLTVLYELVFAYENGVAIGSDAKRNLEAGTILRGLPRIALGYTGAFMWFMQAGMGDTVFTPLYQVLKRRGVRFKFFHRVTNLAVTDGELTGIEIARQVNLNVEEYDPLIAVKNLLCWPSEPLYDQIAEGEQLKHGNINLESFWAPWDDPGGTITLNAGEDFDVAVLGISLGTLPFICPQLIQANSAWQAMIDHVKTVQTQALQLWLTPPLDALGYSISHPVSGAYTVTPLDTWADMSHLIDREDWGTNQVHTIAYFTGPMAGPDRIPPPTDHNYPQQAARQVRDSALDLLARQIRPLWPAFNWSALVAPTGADGPKRLDSQWLRANIDPSERYVQTVCGSSQYRLRADGSGFKRLYLAGDWLDNGLNLGSIESAATSGMQAARAISGHPSNIVGDQKHIW